MVEATPNQAPESLVIRAIRRDAPCDAASDDVLGAVQVAEQYGSWVSYAALLRLGRSGVGPPFFRAATPKSPVRYIRGELEKWLMATRVDPASVDCKAS